MRTENLSGDNVELMGGGFLDFITNTVKGIGGVVTSIKDFGKPTTPPVAPAPAPVPTPKGPLGMTINPMMIAGGGAAVVALMLVMRKRR